MVVFIIGVLVPIFGFIIALYQMPKDMLIAKKYFKDKNQWEKLTTKGKRYILICFFSALILEIAFICKDTDTPKTIINTVTKPYPIYVPQLVKVPEIEKDTITSKEKSLIDPVLYVIFKADSNPRLVGTIDSLKFRVEFGCINKGIAYNVLDQLLAFNLKDSRFHFLGYTRRATLESSTVYGNLGLWVEGRLVVNKSYPYKDTTYIYFRVKYANKPINGSEQKPLQKLYYIVRKSLDNSLNDFSKVHEVENEDKYTYLKNKLISQKLW